MKDFNLNKIAAHIKLQRKDGSQIVKKKAGRPRIQPKVRMEIRLDHVLKAKFDKYDQAHGAKGPSGVIVPLLKDFLSKEGYY